MFNTLNNDVQSKVAQRCAEVMMEFNATIITPTTQNKQLIDIPNFSLLSTELATANV